MTLVVLFAILSTAAAQCCTGTGPSIPPNTPQGCQNSITSTVPAVWTLQPANTSCACFPYKCTSKGPTVFGQQCVDKFGFQAFMQSTQTLMGSTYTCVVVNGAQGLGPCWLLVAAALIVAVQ